LACTRLPNAPVEENPATAEDDEESDYSLGYSAGMDNKGLWGDETAEWIRALTTAPKPEYGKKWKRTDDTRQGEVAFFCVRRYYRIDMITQR
jgi:hypothetical protein